MRFHVINVHVSLATAERGSLNSNRRKVREMLDAAGSACIADTDTHSMTFSVPPLPSTLLTDLQTDLTVLCVVYVCMMLCLYCSLGALKSSLMAKGFPRLNKI